MVMGIIEKILWISVIAVLSWFWLYIAIRMLGRALLRAYLEFKTNKKGDPR